MVVGDGTNTVTVGSASYTSVAAQVSAIQSASGYDTLLFTVAENSDGDGVAFTYNAAGSCCVNADFHGIWKYAHYYESHPWSVGVATASKLEWPHNIHSDWGTASETTDLVVSDGTTTVTSRLALLITSIAEQVTAIQGGS